MFKDFYHLKTEPFNTHPDPSIIFISKTHKEAWYYLLFGINTQEPFVVLTGEYGMGKTLLCLRLIQVLKKKGGPPVEYIPTPYEGYNGILRRIAFRLGISPVPEDEGILQDIIYDYFRADTKFSHFYLIIDDAHELNTTTLTKLKHLSTFSHNGFFPVIMVFIAHPSFLKDLKTPALSSLNQRIKRRYHLSRFSFEDTKNYIYYRLLKSGATSIPAFPETTLQKIFAYSSGIPRMINNICDTCLLIGASKELTTIPQEVVDEAIHLVEGSLNEGEFKAEADLQTAPKDEAGAVINISEDIPSGDRELSLSTLMDDTADVQLEKPRALFTGFGNKLRKAAVVSMAAILLMLSGAILSWRFLNDAQIPNLSSLPGFHEEQTRSSNPLSQHPPEDVKVQTLPKKLPAQTDKIVAQVPTLREELLDKPSVELPLTASRIEPIKSEPVGTPLQRSGGADNQPSPNSETVLSAPVPSIVFHPFSIRSSSYQQPDRALAEISEIKQLGLAPYLVKVDLGDMGAWWRIYIGLYSTEEEARSIVKAYKLSNVTVQKTDYTCQLGEFSNETDILNMFAKLKQSGYFPYAFQKARDRFHLYLGAYEKKSEADALHQELQNKGIYSQVVKR